MTVSISPSLQLSNQEKGLNTSMDALFDMIDGKLQDEASEITFASLSNSLKCSVDTAKKLLFSYAEGRGDKVRSSFLVGIKKQNDHSLKIVNREELEHLALNSPGMITSAHLYSLTSSLCGKDDWGHSQQESRDFKAIIRETTKSNSPTSLISLWTPHHLRVRPPQASSKRRVFATPQPHSSPSQPYSVSSKPLSAQPSPSPHPPGSSPPRSSASLTTPQSHSLTNTTPQSQQPKLSFATNNKTSPKPKPPSTSPEPTTSPTSPRTSPTSPVPLTSHPSVTSAPLGRSKRKRLEASPESVSESVSAPLSELVIDEVKAIDEASKVNEGVSGEEEPRQRVPSAVGDEESSAHIKGNLKAKGKKRAKLDSTIIETATLFNEDDEEQIDPPDKSEAVRRLGEATEEDDNKIFTMKKKTVETKTSKTKDGYLVFEDSETMKEVAISPSKHFPKAQPERGRIGTPPSRSKDSPTCIAGQSSIKNFFSRKK
eukprot:GHVN01078752.1.p1 GENE.GHVN01078752.1~~GHVN01078752.1.p1  ORF type:complete len:485 (+),score=150.15 GHVN01078752.1:182-1636(+)